MVATVIDIETTDWLKFDDSTGRSMLSDSSEILEVGFVRFDTNTLKVLTSGTLYFYKPYFNIESKAQEVHGLTREFLKQYEGDFNKNLIALNSLLQSTCIIGKNSEKFDIPYIKAFIEKHAPDSFDIENLTIQLGMKAYYTGKVHYTNNIYSMDMQVLYKDKFHEKYHDKYSITVGVLGGSEEAILKKYDALTYGKVPTISREDLIAKHNQCKQFNLTDYVWVDPEHMPLPKSKLGKLEQYIDVIDNGRAIVDDFYAGLKKDRVTGLHGALYDACGTFVVWLDGRLCGLW